MILYFSGTGNSKAVALQLGSLLNDDVMMILDESPARIMFSGEMLGLVFPVYSWGVPPLVLDYLRRLNGKFLAQARVKPVYMICVCGDETARAPEMLKRALKEIGLPFSGGWSVQMPNNYVLLPGFDVDSHDVERRKLEAAPEVVKEISRKILAGEWEEKYVRGNWQFLKSGIVYPLFKHWGIFPNRWNASDACVSCGKCAAICPMRNIDMKDGKPCWGKNCVSCLACYHICPRHAVEYGKATLNKGQYFYPGKWK